PARPHTTGGRPTPTPPHHTTPHHTHQEMTMTEQPTHYRRRPLLVEAIQWTGTNAAQLRGFAGSSFDEIAPECRTDPDVTAMVCGFSEWMLLRPGNWVVRCGEGFEPMGSEEFAEMYAPAGIEEQRAATDRAAALLDAANFYESVLTTSPVADDPRYFTAVRDIVMGLRHRAGAVYPEPELTADEARALADDLGTDLYQAQDALAFVTECCDIADRERRTITTADVREWLKGPRCGRQLLADAQDRAVLPAPADRVAVLREAAQIVRALPTDDAAERVVLDRAAQHVRHVALDVAEQEARPKPPYSPRQGIFNYLTGRAICSPPRPLDEADGLLNAYRAAELRAAADAIGRMDYDTDASDYGYDTYRDAWNGGVMDAAGVLRRMADEEQQPADDEEQM
ncbi:hypothetical protein, partial [Streptomyces sp. H27-C3]|uniref:hypothetical protein n=1 Tax=Streptomyces sp. H27-C3 TaxID=3046305 RepID=UPI0024BB559C